MCAVSGGADSLALLVLAIDAGCLVTAVHVDHGLREGSAAEAGIVVAAAERFGAEVRCETVALDPGPNLEARARAARYGMLPDDVLTGHTADDQAETLLLALLRGSGPLGLAAMTPGFRRPILALRRSETEALCASLDLPAVDDPSNVDPAFRRNRVRHELLPLLADIAERDIVPVLNRQSGVQRDLVGYLDQLAAAIDPADCRDLVAAPHPVATHALRRWLREETGAAYGIDFASVERVLAVARGDAVAAEVNGGWRVARTDRRLRVEAPASPGVAPVA